MIDTRRKIPALLAIAGFVLCSGGAARAADFSAPRLAVISFLKATDEAGMREAIVIDPATSKEVETFLGVMIASMKLQKAAEEQFGASAAQYFSKGTDLELQARLKSVNAAEVENQGDSATLILAPEERVRPTGDTYKTPETRIALKKVGGLWKVDAASMFKIGTAPKEETAKQLKMAEVLTPLTEQMIKDLKDKKFSSANEAYQVYWTRSLAAVEKLSGPKAASSPATAPTSLPAESPK